MSVSIITKIRQNTTKSLTLQIQFYIIFVRLNMEGEGKWKTEGFLGQ